MGPAPVPWQRAGAGRPPCSSGACGPWGQVSTAASALQWRKPSSCVSPSHLFALVFKLNLAALHSRGHSKERQLLAGHHGHPGSLAAFVENEG